MQIQARKRYTCQISPKCLPHVLSPGNSNNLYYKQYLRRLGQCLIVRKVELIHMAALHCQVCGHPSYASFNLQRIWHKSRAFEVYFDPRWRLLHAKFDIHDLPDPNYFHHHIWVHKYAHSIFQKRCFYLHDFLRHRGLAY